MSRWLDRTPLILFALGFVSPHFLRLSPLAFFVLVAVLIVAAAADGRVKTVGALVGGWTTACFGILFLAYLSERSRTPNRTVYCSTVGPAFVVFPMVLAALTVVATAVFAVPYGWRKRRYALAHPPPQPPYRVG